MSETINWLVELVKVIGLIIVAIVGVTVIINLIKEWFA